MTSLPPNLPPCDPRDRFFPTAWKQSYFLRNYDQDRGGYICPDCKKVFCGPAGFQQLEADHIIPYARDGSTVWENLTLRCKPCNLKKRDKVDPLPDRRNHHS